MPFRVKREIADASKIQRSVVQSVLCRHLQRVPPVASVKVCQSNAAPMRIAGQFSILHLNVHHYIAGLLDLANAAQVYFRTESGHQRVLYAKIAKISAGAHTRQDEENECAAGQGKYSENAGDDCQ